MPDVSTRLHVADGQYWIWDPAADLALPETYDGLIAATAGLAIVRTGTQSGWVAVRIAVAGAAPGLDTDGWDEVAEVSLYAAPDSPGLSVTSDGTGPDELAALTPAGAGSYRVRVHARGRDAGAAADVVAGAPVEEHLIQVWPARPAPEAVHKTVGGEGELKVPAGPWNGPTDADPAHVALRLPVAAAGRAEAVLADAWVYPDGILFEVRVTADVEGLRPREAQRLRKAVDSYEGAPLPGSGGAGGLRVRIDLPDGRSAACADAGRLGHDALPGRLPAGRRAGVLVLAPAVGRAVHADAGVARARPSAVRRHRRRRRPGRRPPLLSSRPAASVLCQNPAQGRSSGSNSTTFPATCSGSRAMMSVTASPLGSMNATPRLAVAPATPPSLPRRGSREQVRERPPLWPAAEAHA